MIPNSSDTARCDQILKQMMYGERKVRKKRKLGRGREKRMRMKVREPSQQTKTIDLIN